MSLFNIACIFALTVAGLLCGVEFCISAFVHPQLRRLEDTTHVRAAQALARVLGRVMPLWYAAALLASVGVAWLLHRQGGTGAEFVFAVAAAALYAGLIAYTVALLVPINNAVAGWNIDTLPADWRARRARWDMLHAWRVAGLAVAFVCLAAACVGPHVL